MNKILNEYIRVVTIKLVKLIQHRSKMKIKKLTLTYIVEDISKIDMNFETNIDTHRAWLHHTNCITLQPRNSGHQYLPMGININMNQNVVNNDDSGGGGDGDALIVQMGRC